MYKAMYLSPMIPSYDLSITTAFFRDVLGFSALMHVENYAIYEKNSLTIHILRAGSEIGQMEFYLEVDDIETLWESIKSQIKDLRVKEPFNQDYGMREIHIEIPMTKALLFIGQEIK